MNQISEINAPAIATPAGRVLQPERIKALLPVLRGQLIQTDAEAVETRHAVTKFSEPAAGWWVAKRVVTLLSHYFINDFHPEALDDVARDWMAELASFPDWAIEAAAGWWLSQHNPDRRKKPMPGDISVRADAEMAIIRAAENKLRVFERYGNNPPAFMR